MSKIYLVALEVNLEKYLSIVEGNRKAAMIEGALAALGVKRSYRKLKLEQLISSWSTLCNILTRNGGSLAAETFYATLLPDSLHIKGAAVNVINNSFVFSALNGRKNEFERFCPAPSTAAEKARAADMVSSLGSSNNVEIGVMAFFYDGGSEFDRAVLEKRKELRLPHGEIHIFEYCDDKYVYPSFIDVDTGKIDGFIAGNINSRMAMNNIRANIVSLSEKILVAHRSQMFAPIEQINEWLPVAKPKTVKKRTPQRDEKSSPLKGRSLNQKGKRSKGMKIELDVTYSNADTGHCDEGKIEFEVNDSKTQSLVSALNDGVTGQALEELFKHLYDNPNMNGVDAGVVYEDVWKDLSFWAFEKLGWFDVTVDVNGLVVDGRRYEIDVTTIDTRDWALQLDRAGYMYCYN